jgi:glucosyl-dolichyl phosphate glucuronosyltransferase
VTAAPAVSIVICTYSGERWSGLVRTVEAVRSQLEGGDEIILSVDHNSPLALEARRRWPDLSVLDSDGPRGLSGARNSGLSAAHGEIVAFLDDDAIPTGDWLRRLRERYRDPEVLAVGGTVEPAWERGKPRWFPEELAWVVGCTYRGVPEQVAPVRNLIGANMSFRAEVFRDIGSFRNGIGRVGSLPEGCEETEICIRAGQRWPERVILFDPEIRVVHHVPPRRATWRYLVARCYREGISKAVISREVGAHDGLAVERSYATRTLPRAVVTALSDAGTGRDPYGFARAGTIIAGLGVTSAGYVIGRVRGRATGEDAVGPGAINRS